MTNFDLAAGLEILERTPRTFSAMVEGVSPVWADGTEGPETWSPYVILGHLVHSEQSNWIPRARIILEQDSARRFESLA
jgi:hypothetical protein